MSRRRPLSTLQNISEINMTPLMDLTFILLITFIITFPLIEQGIPINLPKADADELSADEARTIAVDSDGRVYLDELPLSLTELGEEMRRLAAAAPDTTVYVRGDEALQYGTIINIMSVLHEAGLTRMALVTQADGS